MSPELGLLIDVWAIVKDHVTAKERVDVAEQLLRAFDEHVDISDIDDHKNEFDRAMKAAILSHFEGFIEDEDDDDDWD